MIEERLDTVDIKWSDKACACIMMASGGYPGSFKKELPIRGLNDVDNDIMVFHAGTKIDSSGKIVTDGGRVLSVVALGKNLAEARQKVYNNISRIHFEGCHYRRDIALFD